MIGKTIYDISTDELREATQEDVDRMQKALAAGRYMVMALRVLIPEVMPPPSWDSSFIDRLAPNLRTFLLSRGVNPDGLGQTHQEDERRQDQA